jgi:F-type H+-transporting ATPase subunit b
VGAAADKAAAGLPQFDPSFFTSQFFWLAVSFVLLYWLLSQALLPKVDSVLATRAKTIKNDVDSAAKANAAAAGALQAYEKSLAGAKREARQAMDTVRAEAASARNKASAEADAKFDARLTAAEAKASAERAAGMDAARTAAADVAASIVARLTGAQVSADDARKAVGS